MTLPRRVMLRVCRGRSRQPSGWRVSSIRYHHTYPWYAPGIEGKSFKSHLDGFYITRRLDLPRVTRRIITLPSLLLGTKKVKAPSNPPKLRGVRERPTSYSYAEVSRRRSKVRDDTGDLGNTFVMEGDTRAREDRPRRRDSANRGVVRHFNGGVSAKRVARRCRRRR